MNEEAEEYCPHVILSFWRGSHMCSFLAAEFKLVIFLLLLVLAFRLT